MPALGLSNKAVYDADLTQQQQKLAAGDSADVKREAYPEVYFKPQQLTRMLLKIIYILKYFPSTILFYGTL